MEVGDREKIRLVGEAVMGGGVIIYPTDTVLGIGGNPFMPSVVRRVFDIKHRDSKPMPVLVSGRAQAEHLVEVDSLSSRLMELLWPGALTLVLNKRRLMPFELTMGSGKLGVRMPNHALALELLDASGGALIGTSANHSGRPAPKGLDELDPNVERGADIVVDGGGQGNGVSSTVVEVSGPSAGGPWRVKIIREGAVRALVIKEKLRDSEIKGEFVFEGV